MQKGEKPNNETITIKIVRKRKYENALAIPSPG